MRALAKQAGVSPSTISRALRNDPQLPPATRQRLQQLASELGYQANPVVAHLTTQLRQSRQARYQATLGFIHNFDTPDFWSRAGSSWSQVLPGLRARASELGYDIDEFWLREPAMTGRRMSAILQNRGIRGLFIPPLHKPIGHLTLDWSRFMALTIGYRMAKPALHAIGNDHFYEINLALRRLRRLGYQRIGLILDPKADQYAETQYSTAFHHYSMPGRSLSMFWLSVPWSTPQPPGLEKWLDRYKPDAVLSMNRELLEFLRPLRKVPGELGFAALDLDRTDSRCAGIFTHPRQCMSAAVDFLVSQLQLNHLGLPEVPIYTRLQGFWVDGPTLRKSPRFKT